MGLGVGARRWGRGESAGGRVVYLAQPPPGRGLARRTGAVQAGVGRNVGLVDGDHGQPQLPGSRAAAGAADERAGPARSAPGWRTGRSGSRGIRAWASTARAPPETSRPRPAAASTAPARAR